MEILQNGPLYAVLHNETLRAFSGQNNKKLFYSSQIGWAKNRFIEAFLKKSKMISVANARNQESFQRGAI